MRVLFVAREPHTETITLSLDYGAVALSPPGPLWSTRRLDTSTSFWADRRVWCGARWKSSTGAKAGGVLKRSLRIMPLDCTVGMILPDVITPRLARRAATQRRL